MSLSRVGKTYLKLSGSNNGMAKLTDDDVLMIRYLDKFCSQTEIGKIYQIAQSHVGLIIRKKTWKHI